MLLDLVKQVLDPIRVFVHLIKIGQQVVKPFVLVAVWDNSLLHWAFWLIVLHRLCFIQDVCLVKGVVCLCVVTSPPTQPAQTGTDIGRVLDLLEQSPLCCWVFLFIIVIIDESSMLVCGP